MELEKFLHDFMKSSRAKSLEKSDQLTLGEMILKLEPIVEKHKGSINGEPHVKFDFGNLFPTELDSWRGSYEELALNYTGEGEQMTVTAFYEMLKGAIGKEYYGYKGGDFTMHKRTPVWVDNYGHAGNTAVIEIVDRDYEIIIMTGYREF